MKILDLKLTDWTGKIALFSGFLILSSCFSIKEKVVLNNDGSGRYAFTVDLGQMKQVFQMSQQFQKTIQDSTGFRQPVQINPLNKIVMQFEAYEYMLENIKGISNYEVISDTVNYIVGAAFDFSDIETLNKGITKLQADTATYGQSIEMFRYKDKIFERLNTQGGSLSGKAITAEDSAALETYRSSTYSIEYIFDRKVRDYDNDHYFLSRDKKTLTAEFGLVELIKGEKEVGNKIRLR